MGREHFEMSAAPADVDADRSKLDDDFDQDPDERNYHRVIASSTLNGTHVRNSAGEDLGNIEEIMIDAPSGRVAYAVLSFGGFLGFGGKLFAVPWKALVLNEREHEYILNVDKHLLENAPGFDKDNWPDMADPSFTRTVYSYYGYKP